MDETENFRSGYFEWLVLLRDQLEEIEYCDNESEWLAQSWDFVQALWRVRRECEVLQGSLPGLLRSGRLDAQPHAHASTFLHDLCWLLDISPSAAPAMARQCVRIALDRVAAEEAQVLGDAPSDLIARSWADSSAVA